MTPRTTLKYTTRVELRLKLARVTDMMVLPPGMMFRTRKVQPKTLLKVSRELDRRNVVLVESIRKFMTAPTAFTMTLLTGPFRRVRLRRVRRLIRTVGADRTPMTKLRIVTLLSFLQCSIVPPFVVSDGRGCSVWCDC